MSVHISPGGGSRFSSAKSSELETTSSHGPRLRFFCERNTDYSMQARTRALLHYRHTMKTRPEARSFYPHGKTSIFCQATGLLVITGLPVAAVMKDVCIPRSLWARETADLRRTLTVVHSSEFVQHAMFSLQAAFLCITKKTASE